MGPGLSDALSGVDVRKLSLRWNNEGTILAMDERTGVGRAGEREVLQLDWDAGRKSELGMGAVRQKMKQDYFPKCIVIPHFS